MSKELIPQEIIERNIFMLRGKKVMLDQDLARLYGVQTKVLNRAVKRNVKRFPEDFMFVMTRREYSEFLRCQIGTLEQGRYSKYCPFAFTENGVAMLSGLLNSQRAVAVNIQIMRTFTKIREFFRTHSDLKKKIEALENKYDAQFKSVFDAIRMLMEPPAVPDPCQKKTIGFKPGK